jgi:hypothetical protein
VLIASNVAGALEVFDQIELKPMHKQKEVKYTTESNA